MLRRALFATIAAATLAVTGTASAQDARNYILATASTGGTYYPVGVALSTLVKVKLEPRQKIGMSAISSAGSGENVRLLRENEAQFAIVQGLFGYYARNGLGPLAADGAQENLRAVSMLWQNVEHFVVASEHVTTGTVSDFANIKGMAAALGRQNSGTIGSNRTILSHLGLDLDSDFELLYAGYGPSATALQDGRVAGISTPAGAPVGAISRLMASAGDRVQLLSFTAEQATLADGGFNLWTPYTIAAGTYAGQDSDVTTIAQPNFLATRADTDEDAVYQITKTMYENLAFLRAIHPATNAMDITRAINGLPMQLHPGAQRYYEEVFIQIPDSLIAQ